ncbi:MAG: phosphoglucosamine mutase [Alphaproteobacteria bacterium]
MRKLFGTDGIRGTANREPMTAETALRVAMAAGHHFRRGDHKHLVVIGKDTRLSGYMLEPALQAGFIAMGMDVMLLGPLPTPGVAMLTRSLRADLGVMLSASHNPFEDNGIKLFGPDGWKLSDEVEIEIEHLVENGLDDVLAPPAELGRARRLDDAVGRYIEIVKNTFPKQLRLDGLKIVVDCANGAAYKAAPRILWELGADVVTMGADPDGMNINHECGATHLGELQKRVVAEGADIGLALDGDADRLIIVDETGSVMNGDQVMALVAKNWQETGRLMGGGVVATVMSNLGFERYLDGLGLTLVRTQVGDRYVCAHMRDHGFNVGGEQSGHIILSDYSTTGDGLIAALQVLAALVSKDDRVSHVGHMFDAVPQLLKNVPYQGRLPLDRPDVQKAVVAAERRLGRSGRLLIRPSGTEPVIRVMAEGDDLDLVGRVVDDIVGALEKTAQTSAA